MIGIENHLLGPLYTIPITIWWYLTIWAHFCTKCERVSFLHSKEKNSTFFFKNWKSTSTWLRSINDYYESKVHTLKIFLSYLYDIPYSKYFPSFFGLQNENCAWFLHKNIFSSFGCSSLWCVVRNMLWDWFFISDNRGSIWTM